MDGGRVHVSEAWWSSWGQAVPARVPQKGVGGETGRDLGDFLLLRESCARRALRLMSQMEPGQNWLARISVSFCRKGCTKKMAAGPCHGPRWPERPPRAGL